MTTQLNGFGQAATMQRGFIVLREWADLIFQGKKTIELKKQDNQHVKHTTVGICVSGTGMVAGQAYIADVKLLSQEEARSDDWSQKHCVPRNRLDE